MPVFCALSKLFVQNRWLSAGGTGRARAHTAGTANFGHITIRYVPDKLCVESKSLKLYLFSYRNHGAFHEEVVNRILDDL